MCFNGLDPELAALLAGSDAAAAQGEGPTRAEALLALVTLSLLSGVLALMFVTGGFLG